jgi:hypothetical protein
VTAVVRDPAAYGDLASEGVWVVAGDATRATEVAGIVAEVRRWLARPASPGCG